MSKQDYLNSRIMLWFTIVILPVVGIALSVYEIFFNKGDASQNQPQTQNVVLNQPTKQEAPAQKELSEPLKKELHNLRKEVKDCYAKKDDDKNFKHAVTRCEDFMGKNPEAEYEVKKLLAEVYFDWGEVKYRAFNLTTPKNIATANKQELGYSKVLAENWAGQAKEKFQASLDNSDVKQKQIEIKLKEMEEKLREISIEIEKREAGKKDRPK